MNRRGTEGFVTVATFTNSLEANLAKQHLEAGGVRCFLRDESTVDVAWHLSVAVGWIKLQVSPADLDLAKSILTATALDYPEMADADLPEEDEEIIQVSWADKTADRAFVAAVISLIFPFLPVQIYSLWLLIRLWVSRQQVNANRRIKVIVALCLDLLSLFILWNIFFR